MKQLLVLYQKDKIEIVVNNIEGAEKERKGNAHQIEKNLKR